MNYGDYVIYVDESGDHSLTSIDNGYPIFVLDFCVFRKEDYANVIVPRVQTFKFKHFGHDIVVLHEKDIRKQNWPFSFLSIKLKQEVFMKDLNKLIDEADFTIIATVIDKQRLADKYITPENPYELGLKFCMERAFAFLQEKQQHTRITPIVVERRGKREDNDLELAFRRIRDGENYQGAMSGFELVFAEKRINSAGLQLADLTARPIGRHVMTPEQPNRAWSTIEKKLHRNHTGSFIGWGLKVFP